MADPRLIVSFSGGKTSAYMAKMLKSRSNRELKFVFANTGCEDERTLTFADRCDREWGLGLVWVEAVVNAESGSGTTHQVVTFETANRDGEPFRSMIAKYGIPNMKFPHCTRELKDRPIRDWAKSIGWDDAPLAIGMRMDEPSRIGPHHYPLFDWFPTDKASINEWWDGQPFSLELLEHEGNCQWCWKKSDKKLIRIAMEAPDRFDFPQRMESQFPLDRKGKPARFFRGSRSVQDLIDMAAMIGPGFPFHEYEDENAGCSESCEPFTVTDPTAGTEAERG